MDAVRITVLRPFFLASQRQEAGAVIEVPKALAVELCAYGKAAAAPADDAKPAPKAKKESKS